VNIYACLRNSSTDSVLHDLSVSTQLSSGGLYHDELDFEFLGNETYQPYILQTNVFANGTGNREQRIYLWFDPTADFHTYSFLWTRDHIV